MLFSNRWEAGKRLGLEVVRGVTGIRERDALVLAIPRGGVPVGYAVARAVDAPLDIFVARKLGAPGHEELGIGAVAPGGARFLDADAIRSLGVTDSYIEEVTRRELAELERRLRRFRGDRPPPRIEGRVVVLVDDGLATGVTALASLGALRLQHPAPRAGRARVLVGGESARGSSGGRGRLRRGAGPVHWCWRLVRRLYADLRRGSRRAARQARGGSACLRFASATLP